MKKFKVWHMPQVPMKAFEVEVESIEEAWRILNILWDYDKFQYKNQIKPDWLTDSGLEYWDEDRQEWLEWTDDDGVEVVAHFKSLEDRCML